MFEWTIFCSVILLWIIIQLNNPNSIQSKIKTTVSPNSHKISHKLTSVDGNKVIFLLGKILFQLKAYLGLLFLHTLFLNLQKVITFHNSISIFPWIQQLELSLLLLEHHHVNLLDTFLELVLNDVFYAVNDGDVFFIVLVLSLEGASAYGLLHVLETLNDLTEFFLHFFLHEWEDLLFVEFILDFPQLVFVTTCGLLSAAFWVLVDKVEVVS